MNYPLTRLQQLKAWKKASEQVGFIRCGEKWESLARENECNNEICVLSV
jgi:hypothetical protein